MHRLREDDLVAHVLAQEDWEIVRLPAIAEEDETIVVDSLLGPRSFQRRRGEALHPAREPIATLADPPPFRRARARACRVAHLRRARIGEYNFRRPVSAGPLAIGRRARQGSLVQALHSR
jgi:hypothetical protein